MTYVSKIFLTLSVLLLGSLAPNSGNALSVNFKSGTTSATSVIGLDIGGTLYDVEFTQDLTHADIAASTFVWTSFADANAPNSALATALQDAGATALYFDKFDNTFTEATTWTSADASFIYGRRVSFNGTTWSVALGQSSAPINSAYPFTALWSVSSASTPGVPLPAGLPLLATAFAFSGIALRRRR